MEIKLLYNLGKYLKMMSRVFKKPENYNMYWTELFRQMNDIGIGSLPIVGLISIFIGMVTAVQFAYQLDGNLVPRYYIGYVVRDISIIELAPTITSLVLAGKVGSNMASEIGGMRQKEHIDAMEIMGVNTIGYLILPRVLAAIIVIPMLVTIASFISIIGGYLSSVPTGLIPSADYIRGVRSFFVPYNVFMMLVKSFVFAYILTTISCYQGYYVKSGSIELGKASTQAVVYSDIVILLADYIIAILLTSS